MMNSIQSQGEVFTPETKQFDAVCRETQIASEYLIPTSCLGSFCDPLKRQRVSIWMKEHGSLYARVEHFAKNGTIFNVQDNVELTGIPKALSNEIDLAKWRSFFRLTHFVPEKDRIGNCSRVTVHISGKGGIKPMIPFQPGLALGTIVRGDIIIKMEKYADAMTKKEALQGQVRTVENQIEAVESKIDMRMQQLEKKAIRDKMSRDGRILTRQEIREKFENQKNIVDLAVYDEKQQSKQELTKDEDEVLCDGLLYAYTKEKKVLEDYLDAVLEALDAEDEGDSLPDPQGTGGKDSFFAKFQQGIVSPVDMKASVIEIQPRAFDSMNYNSTYINRSENNEGIEDKIAHSASASSFSAGGGIGIFGISLFSAGASHSYSSATGSRVTQIFKESKTEGVLVINAFVTTRYVRAITDVQYDLAKLEQILAVMNSSDEEHLKRYGITFTKEAISHAEPSSVRNNNNVPPPTLTNKCIYILTEAVLGGSFTALVTFLDESDAKVDQNRESSSSDSSTQASASGGFLGFGWGGSYAGANTRGNIDEQHNLNSIRQTKVNIEFISQGVLPEFSRQVIEKEILKHLDLNPSKYELSEKDASEAEQMLKRGPEGERALARRVMKMENAQVAILNACKGITATKEKQNIHTMESVMGAYESFAEKITEDKECGIPVGFYYEMLTQNHIEDLVKELKRIKPVNRTQPAPPAVQQNGQASGNTSAASGTTNTASGGQTTSGPSNPSTAAAQSGQPASGLDHTPSTGAPGTN